MSNEQFNRFFGKKKSAAGLVENDELANTEQIELQDAQEKQSTGSLSPEKEPEEVLWDVSDCIEKIGYGTYHWKVVMTMGMMSIADSSEIWIISLITYNLVCEWGLSTLEKALIPGLVFAAMAVGSFVSGSLSDYYGRQKVMLVVYYIFTVAGLSSALAWNYYVFVILRCIAGFCIGANYGISICYSAEMVPMARRGFNLLLLDLLWAFGGVYICFCAFLVMDMENGWRILIALAAVPCIIAIPLVHFCDESVRYLVIHGRIEEARVVLDKMADANKVERIQGGLIQLSQPKVTVLDMFRQPFTRRTIVIGIMFGVIVWVFYSFLYLLPDMMSYSYCYMSQFFTVTYIDASGCKVYTKAEYLFLMVVNILYIPGYIISPLTAEHWGRRPTLWYSYWASLFVTASLLICISAAIVYVELFIIVNLYAIGIATIWLYTPECYPTYIRSTATGAHNGMSKIGAAAGTFLTEYLDTVDIVDSIFVSCAVLLIACIASLFLRIETMGKSLRDDTDFGESPEESDINFGETVEYGTNNNEAQQEAAM